MYVQQCALCPLSTGAFKATCYGSWCHVVCAQWLPGIALTLSYEISVHLCNSQSLGAQHSPEKPISVTGVLLARFTLLCSVCGVKGGACIQCSWRKCATAFHVTCAQASLRMCTRKEEDALVREAYCKRHTDPEKLLPLKKRTQLVHSST